MISDPGHEWLWNQGILHRNISAGNILLATDPSNALPRHEGFLIDLELAAVKGHAVVDAQLSDVRDRPTRDLTIKTPAFIDESSQAQGGAAMTVQLIHDMIIVLCRLLRCIHREPCNSCQ